MSKACTKCGVVKPLDGFYRDKTRADGRKSLCKECDRERSRRYYEANRDNAREYNRRYREENREKERDRHRSYYEENREKEADRSRRYREENREKVREQKRRYWEENRDKELEKQRQYREENRDNLLDGQRRYREENRDIINQVHKSRYAHYTRASNLLASKKGAPYSPDEDAFLMADNGMSVYQKAVELGRTYASVATRKHILRARANH